MMSWESSSPMKFFSDEGFSPGQGERRNNARVDALAARGATLARRRVQAALGSGADDM